MTITIIEQSTSERNEETKDLFEAIRPYLDKGYSYMTACVKVGRVTNSTRNSQYGFRWFRDLKEYGETQGYPYNEYSGKRRK